jgi:hypothetical protein
MRHGLRPSRSFLVGWLLAALLTLASAATVLADGTGTIFPR